MMLMAPKWVRAAEQIASAAPYKSPAGLYPRQTPRERHEFLRDASTPGVARRGKGEHAMHSDWQPERPYLGGWIEVAASTPIPRQLIAS
jgi:hypothetical protein